MKLSYDLHLHSCLSPCGDAEMTPNNIVNMAALLGLDLIAVSDHNSALNLPAVFKAVSSVDLLVVPAIEACSSEEVHLLCLFETLDGALECSSIFRKALPPIRNKPEFFGEQQILNANDEWIGSEELLLINALSLNIKQVQDAVQSCGGMVIPAHVNKKAYSLLAVLGSIPEEYRFSCIEVNPPDNSLPFAGHRISDSDAHALEQMQEPSHFIELPERSTKALLDTLCGRI